MKKTKRVYTRFGKAAKYDGCLGIEPLFGYNWFYFLPHFSWNGGFNYRNEVFDWGVGWLIFHWGITIYPKSHKDSYGDSAKITSETFNN